MAFVNLFDCHYWFKIMLCFCVTVLIQGGLSLKDVQLQLQPHVLDGSDVRLSCRYNMEGDALYAVKWYRDGQEFYRYIPKEVPPIQVFRAPGLDVDIRRSNHHDVVLTRLTLDSSGNYKCVVSAESPFQTLSDSRDLLVILIGDDRPFLQLDGMPHYGPGDQVTVRCHVPASLPEPANITWYLNNEQIMSDEGGDLIQSELSKQSHPKTTEFHKSDRQFVENGGMLISSLTFALPPSDSDAKVQLKCRTRIYTLYDQNVTLQIDSTSSRVAMDSHWYKSKGFHSTLWRSGCCWLLDWWPLFSAVFTLCRP